MWYRQSKSKDRTLNYEGKILATDAERCIRRHLFLQGNYGPSPRTVQTYVEQTLQALEQRFGSLNNVRHALNGERLLPMVEEIVSSLFAS